MQLTHTGTVMVFAFTRAGAIYFIRRLRFNGYRWSTFYFNTTNNDRGTSWNPDVERNWATLMSSSKFAFSFPSDTFRRGFHTKILSSARPVLETHQAISPSLSGFEPRVSIPWLILNFAMGRRTWGLDLNGQTWRRWCSETATNTDGSQPVGKVSVVQAKQWKMGTKQGSLSAVVLG